MPIFLTIAFRVFDLGQEAVDFPIGDLILQIAALTIVPVAIGMGLRRWKPRLCDRFERPSKIFVAVFLGLVVVALVVTNWSAVAENAVEFAPAFIVLNLAGLAVGYGVSKAFGLDRRQSSTIGVETGLQNSTLALTIAVSVLGNSELAIIPGLYGVWMLFTGFAFAYLTQGAEQTDPQLGR
ncbi:MAG: BASS family bile acid:Na+ symporter [Acidimicrobiales bacterium]|jgi:BASS family bile acid:Na+ symporter